MWFGLQWFLIPLLAIALGFDFFSRRFSCRVTFFIMRNMLRRHNIYHFQRLPYGHFWFSVFFHFAFLLKPYIEIELYALDQLKLGVSVCRKHDCFSDFSNKLLFRSLLLWIFFYFLPLTSCTVSTFGCKKKPLKNQFTSIGSLLFLLSSFFK